jgi:hypothetical protein
LWPEKQRGHNEQTSAEDRQAHSRAYRVKKYILMLFGKPNHWYPDDSRQQRIERKYWRRQFWVSWATLVSSWATLIFLIIGSGIAYKAFRETQRQARAAIEANRISRNTLIAGNRAWLNPVQFEFVKSIDAADGPAVSASLQKRRAISSAQYQKHNGPSRGSVESTHRWTILSV